MMCVMHEKNAVFFHLNSLVCRLFFHRTFTESTQIDFQTNIIYDCTLTTIWTSVSRKWPQVLRAPSQWVVTMAHTTSCGTLSPLWKNLFFTSRKEERLVKNGHPSPDGHNKAIFHVNYSYHLASVAIVERFSTDENKRLLFSKLSWWKYSIKNTKSTSQTISDDSIDTFIFKTVTYARTKPLISLIRDSTSNLFDYTENRVSNRASVISLNI